MIGDRRLRSDASGGPRRVLVTCPPMLRRIEVYRTEFERRRLELHCPEVTQTLDQDTLLRLVPQVDGWIAGDDPASRSVLAAGRAGRLRAVVKWGVGIDNVDRDAVSELGLRFAHTPAMFGAEVADMAVGYLIALARQTFFVDRRVRDGEWPKPCGVSLAGKTVALAGFGDVGRQIARRLQAMDMRVIAYDPALSPPGEADGPVIARWPERFEEADVLVLACALTDSNRHLIDGRALGRAKRGLRVVNVARGALIDEAALAEALENGTVAAAALDVFEREPLPAQSPLRHYEQCVFGSHNASNTVEAVDRASRLAMEKLFEFLGA